MARIRSLKPDFFKDEDLAGLHYHWTPVGSAVRQISQTKTLRFIAKYLKWKELMKV